MSKRVSVVILNYNVWADTIECLNSIARMEYDDYDIVVVDNHSGNDSVLHLRSWAEHFFNLSSISSTVDINGKRCTISKIIPAAGKIGSFVLIEAQTNGGYAAGNNLGIFYSFEILVSEYVWILNNDTVVDTEALSHLVATVQKEEKIGVCGSVLFEYRQKEQVQSYKGDYNVITGRTVNLLGVPEDEILPNKQSAFHILFPVGASLLVKKQFVADVGYMNEAYFLYFEEVDWLESGKRGGWTSSISMKSRVWHKGGGTIIQTSKLNDYFLIRSKIRFTRKFFPWALPFVYCSMIVFFVNRVVRGQYDRLLFSLRICMQPSISVETVIAHAQK